MTKKTIKRLTAYYTKAIRKGKTVKDMRDAIFATIYHGFSTDARPQHDLCPKHVGSWCFYQDATARGMDTKKLKCHSECQRKLAWQNLAVVDKKSIPQCKASQLFSNSCHIRIQLQLCWKYRLKGGFAHQSQMSKCLGLLSMQKRIDLSLKRATARMQYQVMFFFVKCWLISHVLKILSHKHFLILYCRMCYDPTLGFN